MMGRDVPEIVDRIVHELERKAGQLTAAQAAQIADRSPSTVRHWFTPHVGINFRTARVRTRMKPACDLLVRTPMSIPQIAATLGYSDRTKFEKAFKRIFGMTPTQYRLHDRLRDT